MQHHPVPSDPPSSSRRLAPAGAGRDRFARLRALVAARFAVCGRALLAPGRGRAEIAFARQVAMYLAHVELGASFATVGRAFGRDRTTAAHACRVIEERREDPAFDATLGDLESVLTTADGRVTP